MDIRGIWKVKEIRVPTPDGVKVFTPDNPPQEERFEGSAELMNYRTEFAEDGMLNTLMFVPEEMRQEAAEFDKKENRTGVNAPTFQFMRMGYFCLDSKDTQVGHPVFNRSVSLKESFKK